MDFEAKVDEADALAATILRITSQSIEAGEIAVEDAGVAYLAVAVRLLASCSPQETVARILRANADIVERRTPNAPGAELN